MSKIYESLKKGIKEAIKIKKGELKGKKSIIISIQDDNHKNLLTFKNNCLDRL